MAFGDIVRAMEARQPARGTQTIIAPRARVRVPAAPATPPPTIITPRAHEIVAPPQPSIQLGKPVLDPRHITKLVAKSDAAPQTSRSGGNADRYMHVSSLIGCCEREHCISAQHGLPTATTVNGAMRMIWAIGRAVEKHIRQGVIEARDYHGVYGNWQCPCGAVDYMGEFVRGRICNRCTKEANRYFEPKLTNDFMRVVGSPDLTLVEQGWYMPVEIKSMNKEQFDALEAPLADHCIQGASYRWMYEQMGFPVLDVVPVVYGRKDYKFGGSYSIYKEYHVPYDNWHRQVENNMNTARLIAAHNEDGTLPPRCAGCTSPTSPRAKQCSRSTLCWNL